MQNLLEAVYQADGINGAIDDLPPLDYAEQPPRPRPGFGDARRPFAFVFEGEEPIDASMGVIYQCELPVTIEVVYDYSRIDAERGPKRRGRELLAELQAAVMVDPNRGQRASNTVEVMNAVEESAADGIGVVVWKGVISYARDRRDPNTNVSDAP